MNGYLGGGLCLSLLALWLTWGHAQSIQKEFDTFKTTQEVLAKVQIAENEKLKAELEEQRKSLEADNAKNLADIDARYNAELNRVRSQRTRTRGMPQARQPATVCTDKAFNDRFSDAFGILYERLLGLAEKAERQAVTLKTCQSWIEEVSR